MHRRSVSKIYFAKYSRPKVLLVNFTRITPLAVIPDSFKECEALPVRSGKKEEIKLPIGEFAYVVVNAEVQSKELLSAISKRYSVVPVIKTAADLADFAVKRCGIAGNEAVFIRYAFTGRNYQTPGPSISLASSAR